MTKLIIVDDEVIFTVLLKKVISGLGHEILAIAHSGKDAVELTSKFNPDMVLMDIAMDYKTDGIDACKKIKKRRPEIKIFFLSAFDQFIFKNELKNITYDGYIDKSQLMMDMEGKLMTIFDNN